MTARILVVDDEPDLESLVLQKFRRQIRDGAVSFLFAHDGLEALAMIETNRDIDMVVSDINMPRMDGLSLLQKLQEAEGELSTIIVSAYGDIANIRTAMNRGAFDFLTKPIDFADLETTIAKTMRHLEVLREARRRQSSAERAHASLSRYFSPNLAERLSGDADGIELAGRRREVAALFTDVASFTTLAETIEPGILAELLNEYLVGMTDVVFKHEGTVAKIVGDALHVLFGAPGDQPDHAARAVACALELDAFAESIGRPGANGRLPWARPASASMPGRRSLAILAGRAFSTTPPMATPSTSRQGSKRRTSSSARVSALAPKRRSGSMVSAAGRLAISC